MERDLSRITISVIVLDFELDMAGPVLLHGVKITITYRVVQLASIADHSVGNGTDKK